MQSLGGSAGGGGDKRERQSDAPSVPTFVAMTAPLRGSRAERSWGPPPPVTSRLSGPWTDACPVRVAASKACGDVKTPSCLTARPGLPLTSESPQLPTSMGSEGQAEEAGQGDPQAPSRGPPAEPPPPCGSVGIRTCGCCDKGPAQSGPRTQGPRMQGRAGSRVSGLRRGGVRTSALGLRLCSLRRGPTVDPSLPSGPTLSRASGLHVPGPRWRGVELRLARRDHKSRTCRVALGPSP